jgi:hypothetical protein
MNPSAANAGLFSELLRNDATAMMRRMVATMQAEVGKDTKLGNASYCTLLLKLSENDLVKEFAAGIQAEMAPADAEAGFAKTVSAGLSFSLEPMETVELTGQDDFSAATALLSTLKTAAKGHSVVGSSILEKDFFTDLLKDAFQKSRIDGLEATALMPFARRALNTELVALYKRVA